MTSSFERLITYASDLLNIHIVDGCYIMKVTFSKEYSEINKYIDFLMRCALKWQLQMK